MGRRRPKPPGPFLAHRVLLTGVALIAAQMAFRTWAVAGAWFQFDDVAFLSRVLNRPLDLSLLTDQYGGHLMPGGFLLTALFADASPLAFRPYALVLLALQLLASVGCLVMLRHLFGERWGIIPPLCVYLFSAISLPAFIWWAAGINQLPMQVAFFWSMTTHVSYLRTRKLRYAVATALVIAGGLFFYEKAVLIYGAIGVVTVSYFATGDLRHRLAEVVRRYAAGLGLYVGWGLAYVATYLQLGLDLAPGGRTQPVPVWDLTRTYLIDAFATGILGGPLSWQPIGGPFQIVDPHPVTVVLAVAALGALAVHLHLVRLRSLRAWLVPAWFILCSLVLLAASRAAAVGPVVGLELRYQSELPAAVCLALALAALPLVGAVESAEVRDQSPLLDSRRAVAAVTAGVSCLALVSSAQYATRWHEAKASRQYFAHAADDLRKREGRTPLVNVSVPQYLMWGYRYPENTTRRVLKMYDHLTYYPRSAVDELFVIGDQGHVRPAGVTPFSTVRGRRGTCGYRVVPTTTEVPLSSPLSGGGFWARMTFVAAKPTPIAVRAGQETHRIQLRRGLQSVYFSASGRRFSTIGVSAPRSDVRVCTNEGAVGFPQAVTPG